MMIDDNDDVLSESEGNDGPSGGQRGRKVTNQDVFDCFSQDPVTGCYKCIVAPTKCTYKSKRRHSGNLLSHLKSLHKETADGILKKKNTASKRPIKKAKQIVLNGVKMSGKSLKLYCLLLVAEQGASFKLLDSKPFQSIIKGYLDALPASDKITINRKNIPELIPEYANKVRAIIAEEVKGKLISLKLDGCTRKHRHFIGITAQFIVDGELIVRTLAVEELFIKNNAPLMKSEVTKVLEKFQILTQNLLSMTSDNAAYYLLMVRLFDKAAKEYYDKMKSLDEETLDLIEWAEEENEAEWPSIELINEDSTSVQSVRCGAHTLQLAVDDAMKATPEVKAVLEKARELAKFLSTPTMVRELKKEKLALPTLDTVTRWGSSYDMCESVLRLRPFTDTSLSKKEKQEHGMDAVEWSQVEDLIKCLRPARKATIKLQAKGLLLGDFLCIWSTCYEKLSKLTHPLAQALCNAMDERKKAEMYADSRRGEKLSGLFGYPGFNAALLMDPRYFTLLGPNEIKEAKTYLIEVWRRLCRLKGEAVENEPEESRSTPVQDLHDAAEVDSDEESSFSKELKKKNREKLKNMDPKRSNQAALKIIQLLDNYLLETPPLSEKDDVLKWWQKKAFQHPVLSELAFTVLAQPATQVAVERIFSSLKFVLNPLRFKLSSQHIDDVMILHCNTDLLHRIADSELTIEVLEDNCRPSSSSSSN